MAILKCKMCGGDLEVVANEKVIECEYCGSKQTIVNPNNEKKVNLSNRANRLRINCEFDKAASIYEQIIAEFPEEAEAYWGLCLCNYGIEYVDDPVSAQKIPTCHRASFEKMRKDENYELALENADMTQRIVYEDQAKEIDRIMGEILAVSKDEKPYDIFICYKETDNVGSRTPDSVLAQDIFDALTNKGYRVFFSRITLEDKLGTMYEPYIFSALNSAKIMLVVGTDYEYLNAVWVKNEWSRFLKIVAKDKSKAIIPCYKDMDPYDLPNEFKGLQSQDCSKLGFMQDLTRGIDKLFGKSETQAVQQTVVTSGPQASTLLERAFMFLEDGEWEEANEYAEKVLDIEPKNASAYLVKMLASLKVSKESKLEYLEKPFDDDANYDKACRFDDSIKARLETYIKVINNRNEQAQIEAEKKAEAERIAKKQAYQKKLEDVDKLVKYAKNHDSTYSDSLKNSIAKLNNERNNLLKEKSFIESAPLTIAALKTENDSLTSQISSLENERARLGLFAGSKKKEIDSKVLQFKNNKNNNESKIDELNNKLLNNSVSQIEAKIAEIENNISTLQLELNNLQNANDECDVNSLLYLLKDKEALQIISSDTSKITPLATCKETQYLLLNNPKLDLSKLSVKTKILLNLPLTLGKYANKEIEWVVLEKKGTSVLLISKEIIESKAYNEEDVDITWENCTLRNWLNNDFYNSAFSETEKSQIETTNVSADANPNYSTNPGNATKDKVFLLSITEVNKYFTSDSERECKGTEHAKSNGLDIGINGNSWWWLRSPGGEQYDAAIVFHDGSVGNFGGHLLYPIHGGVRPALWINLES